MGLKIRRKHALVAVAVAAVAVMSAATLAWAAPNITNRTTPPANHVTDGRSVRDCADCHRVTVAVPVIDPTVPPTTDSTVTPTPDSTATPTPDATGTVCPGKGDDHGKKIGHHKGDSTNARDAAHAAQKAKRTRRDHDAADRAKHADPRMFGMGHDSGRMHD